MITANPKEYTSEHKGSKVYFLPSMYLLYAGFLLKLHVTFKNCNEMKNKKLHEENV